MSRGVTSGVIPALYNRVVSDTTIELNSHNDLNSMRVNETGLYKLILGTTKVRAEMGLRHRASRLSDAREPTPSGGERTNALSVLE